MIFTAKVAQSASVLLLMMLTDWSAKPFFFFYHCADIYYLPVLRVTEM